MNNYRNQIDEIDNQLMELINERYKLTKLIGEYKQKNNIEVTNPKREEEVLRKADKYLYSDDIKALYQEMFRQNKFYQSFTYGLIGKSLPYTLSPMIYEIMGLKSYQVIETDDFNKTINKLNFKGINVTIPYKTEAFTYCQELDDSAKFTKTVNTIIGNKGYNTDYLALVDIFKRLGINGSKITIIGNGATARSVQMALNQKVNFLVRTKKNDEEYLLNQYELLTDTEYLINTTPYGTYPQIEDKPLFPLVKFNKLKMVIDVVYNPLNSPLILEAKKYNILTMNGLELLVKQASLNYQLFTNQNIDNQEILKKLKSKLFNIVLIGLSYSGKSTIGKILAEKMDKIFIDTDQELLRHNQDLITVLNNNEPISIYRDYECLLAKKIGLQFNQVIATGGGMVLSEQTMKCLSYNSIIVHLNPSLLTLKQRFDGSRPLLKSVNDIEKMYQERMPLYEKYRMIAIEENTSIEEIVEIIYAYLNN